MYPVVMSLIAAVGCCVWLIYVMKIHIDAPCWKLSNRAPNAASVDMARKLRIVVHNT